MQTAQFVEASVGLCLCFLVPPAAAQTDYRNVDDDRPVVTDWGLAGLRVFGLSNFNTETRLLPALSLRAGGSALTIGPSRAFALRGLMPAGPRQSRR